MALSTHSLSVATSMPILSDTHSFTPSCHSICSDSPCIYREGSLRRHGNQRLYSKEHHLCGTFPWRVLWSSFNDSTLHKVVNDISCKMNCLLEIVNFNVEIRHFFPPLFLFVAIFSPDGWLQGQQYVCARELAALETMTNILNYLKLILPK